MQFIQYLDEFAGYSSEKSGFSDSAWVDRPLHGHRARFIFVFADCIVDIGV